MSLKGKSITEDQAQVRGTLKKKEITAKKEEKADFVSDLPTKPGSLTTAASKYWDEIVPELYEAGVITKVDSAALHVLCENYVTWQNAAIMVNRNKNSALVMTDAGNTKESPELRVMRQAEKRLVAMLEKFGMEPGGRKKVKKVQPGVSNKPKAASEWDEFL